VEGIAYGMVLVYIAQPTPAGPLSDYTPAKCQRNEEIRARYAQGEPATVLARQFGISYQRVHQIVRGQRN